MNEVSEVPSTSVVVILRRKVSVSLGPMSPLAGVERMRVMELDVEEERVGMSGTAGTPGESE